MGTKYPDNWKMEPVYARITSAPTLPAMAGTHEYRGMIQLPEQIITNAPIGPSQNTPWEPPLFVRPLKETRIVKGTRVGGVGGTIIWDYIEHADFGICSTTGGGSLAQSPLVTMWQQASLEERRWLKKQLEAVE